MGEEAIRASAPVVPLQHINESAFNGGFTDYLRGRLGITADLRGYYGTAFITPNPYNIFKPSISEYSFMAGPQYRLVRREHWAIGAQILVGASKGNFNASSSGIPPGSYIGLWSNGTYFSAAAGCANRLQPCSLTRCAYTAELLVYYVRQHSAGEKSRF